METEKELNEQILQITMRITNHYPALSKYLEEMKVTIPNENKPKIDTTNLISYRDSLNSILDKYILEHPTAGTKA